LKYEYEYKDAAFVFVYYKGNSRLGESRTHGNSKHNVKPFLRNAPIVKPKVVDDSNAKLAPKSIYDEITRKLSLVELL
jgi:hypothetical protein